MTSAPGRVEKALKTPLPPPSLKKRVAKRTFREAERHLLPIGRLVRSVSLGLRKETRAKSKG